MNRSYIRTPSVSPSPWMIDSLARAYDWPTGLVGGGVIAIGELGGGAQMSDLDQFCSMIGMPRPTVVDCSVNGGTNSGDPTDPASGEVALDIQAAAASYWVATGKPAVIRVYYAPNASGSIAAATAQAADEIGRATPSPIEKAATRKITFVIRYSLNPASLRPDAFCPLLMR